jgi:hypothetical protein
VSTRRRRRAGFLSRAVPGLLAEVADEPAAGAGQLIGPLADTRWLGEPGQGPSRHRTHSAAACRRLQAGGPNRTRPSPGLLATTWPRRAGKVGQLDDANRRLRVGQDHLLAGGDARGGGHGPAAHRWAAADGSPTAKATSQLAGWPRRSGHPGGRLTVQGPGQLPAGCERAGFPANNRAQKPSTALGSPVAGAARPAQGAGRPGHLGAGEAGRPPQPQLGAGGSWSLSRRVGRPSTAPAHGTAGCSAPAGRRRRTGRRTRQGKGTGRW